MIVASKKESLGKFLVPQHYGKQIIGHSDILSILWNSMYPIIVLIIRLAQASLYLGWIYMTASNHIFPYHFVPTQPKRLIWVHWVGYSSLNVSCIGMLGLGSKYSSVV